MSSRLPSANSRTAVVTGAGRGLGIALSRRLRADGYEVVAVIRQRGQAPALQALGCRPVVADIGADRSMAALRRALAGYEAIDLLINNAGVVRFGTALADLQLGGVEESLQVNCLGALRVTRTCLPWILRAPRPTVINVSTRHASISAQAAGSPAGVPVSYAYRISKAAQNMLTAALAAELGSKGVTVFAVHPGRMRTRLAPADADCTADEAAGKLLEALAIEGELLHGRFVQPGQPDLDW